MDRGKDDDAPWNYRIPYQTNPQIGHEHLWEEKFFETAAKKRSACLKIGYP